MKNLPVNPFGSGEQDPQTLEVEQVVEETSVVEKSTATE